MQKKDRKISQTLNTFSDALAILNFFFARVNFFRRWQIPLAVTSSTWQGSQLDKLTWQVDLSPCPLAHLQITWKVITCQVDLSSQLEQSSYPHKCRTLVFPCSFLFRKKPFKYLRDLWIHSTGPRNEQRNFWTRCPEIWDFWNWRFLRKSKLNKQKNKQSLENEDSSPWANVLLLPAAASDTLVRSFKNPDLSKFQPTRHAISFVVESRYVPFQPIRQTRAIWLFKSQASRHAQVPSP